jgi:hypothetical protein
VAPGFLWRYRLRARDVFHARWSEVNVFDWRTIERREFRVCSLCEKKLDGDPARAAYFTVIRDGGSIWLVCMQCGRKERLEVS